MTQSSSVSLSNGTSPQIHLSCKHALIDEYVKITVLGLAKNQLVTIQYLLQESGQIYGTCGHCIASEGGQVDTFTSASNEGAFSDVEERGHFLP